MTRPAQAASTGNTQDLPITGSFPNPCTGNTDTFAGIFHIVTTTTVSGSGGLHSTLKIHSSDLKINDPTVGQCAGQDQGNPLTLTFNSNMNSNSGGSMTASQRLSFDAVCPGPNNNYVVNITIHTTVNANGTTTSSFSDFNLGSCQ